MTAPAAILAGGAWPIRRAAALRLARRGLSIVLCGPAGDALRAVEAELQRQGAPALCLAADSAAESEASRIVEAARSRFGGIAVLVNGPPDFGPEDRSGDDMTDAEARAMAALKACLRLTRLIVPHIGAGGGRIVYLLSSAARYRSAYFRTGEDSHRLEAVAGGAMLALTRELAFELAPRRIRVNAVVAGLIEEEAGRAEWERMPERDRRFLLQEISLGRFGKPDEVAAAIEFLASDASSYVTGTAIDVNGGWWMS